MAIHSPQQAAKRPERIPAVFLDRDGTINVESEYIYRIEDWEWLDGAQEAILQLNEAGLKVVVVSNQAGIARGMYSSADVDNLHGFVSAELKKIGAKIDAFYYCPHHPEFGGKDPCSCRKPAPGMLLRAAKDLDIDLLNSWMIGDKLIDVQAGKAVSLTSILVRTGYGAGLEANAEPGQIVVDDLRSACRYILTKIQRDKPQ